MIDTSSSGMAYNRFNNLDGIEDRIIYYLLSEKGKTSDELEKVHEIWRILYYNDVDALIDDEDHPLPKYTDIVKLISNDNLDQSDKRIFRTPRLDDGWTEQCSILKIYVDDIIPTDHLKAVVDVGIDIVVNTNIINLTVPDPEDGTRAYNYIDNIDGVQYTVSTKSRVSVLTQCVLSLLNGASVQGVGRLVFSRQNSIYNKAAYGLWNNRDFEGMKVVIGCYMSGVE